MKQLKIITAMMLLLAAFVPAMAQPGPGDGTYFIVNVATGKALTTVDGGVNSNTRLRDFKKSGMQKWRLKKHVAKGKGGKEIASYTIQNTASGFYLRPYFVPGNHEAIVSDKDANSSFSISADGENFSIKSIKMGGDALYSKGVSAGDDEPWFAADEGEERYRWQFIATD